MLTTSGRTEQDQLDVYVNFWTVTECYVCLLTVFAMNTCLITFWIYSEQMYVPTKPTQKAIKHPESH